MNKILQRIGLLFLTVSCFNTSVIFAQENTSKLLPPSWLNDAVFYQIYPQSYYDTDNDGIGDIKGIIQKLDYIKSLGVNALWINPLFDSPFNDAGYDIRNYYLVAPRYGNNEDLIKLFKEAHKRGIRVCLDLVPGHTSLDCKWFEQSAKKERNEYTDRYIWTPADSIKPNNKFVSNNYERPGCYMRNFFPSQPALNYGFGKPDPNHPWEQPTSAEGPARNRQELFNIIDFWMSRGADGFRVDMASSLVKNDPGYIETDKLWNGIRYKLQKKYPNGILISEWGKPNLSIKAGFTMDFMLPTRSTGFNQMFFNFEGDKIIDNCYFDLRGNGDPTIYTDKLIQYLKDIDKKGYLCTPTGTHDRQRMHVGPRDTYEQLKLPFVFLFTLPTVPLIYYGDEIGMQYIWGLPVVEGSQTKINRAGSRTPMQWNNSKNAGFSTADASKLYLPIDRESCIPTVASEEKDPSSLLSFVKQIINLKKTHPALKPNAKIRFLLSKKKVYPLVYERYSNDERIIVILNPSATSQTVHIPYSENFRSIIPLIGGIKSKLEKEGDTLKVTAPPVSYGIYQLKANK
ncbi:MAG: alpha-amylase family glycosyl hydrolase [Bacteroidales bacterium]|jgi:maltose alpha-D-glucosyltransferase/alpha-amylase|nr:alpha-amylase family glycosyl hydrolase [Bacteroidales bacterium]